MSCPTLVCLLTLWCQSFSASPLPVCVGDWEAEIEAATGDETDPLDTLTADLGLLLCPGPDPVFAFAENDPGPAHCLGDNETPADY